MSTTMELRTRALERITRTHELPIPDVLALSDVIQARYAGDPHTELVTRLKHLQGEEHDAAFTRLARTVTPAQAWAAVCDAARDDSAYDVDHFTRTLAGYQMLSLDDRLLDLDQPQIIATAVQQLMRRQTGTFTAPALARFAAQRHRDADWLMSALEHFDALDDLTLDLLVEIVTEEVETPGRATELARARDGHNQPLSEERTLRYATNGALALKVIAFRLGNHTQQVGDLMDTCPTMTVFAVNQSARSSFDFLLTSTESAVKRMVDDLPFHLLTERGAFRILKLATVTHPVMLMELLKLSGCTFTWLSRSYPLNLPTVDLVLEAIDYGLVTGDLVVDRAQFCHRSDWFATAFLATPGVCDALLTELSELGKRIGHPSDDQLAGAATMLELLGNVFGETAHSDALWARFLFAEDSSPFRNCDLTPAQAVEVFLDRWGQAKARRR